MIKAVVVGATGYAGQELVRLLMQHPNVEVSALTSKSYSGINYSNVYNNFMDICDKECIEQNIRELADSVDVIFLALPHGIASNEIDESILNKVKVIDLGADYRLNDKDVYQEWYKTSHGSEDLLNEAVYGLCEWKRDIIKEARLIANPGCYTTCSILSLSPLVKDGLIEESSIIVDAKSGVSGAGRALNLATHYTECNESIKAYKVAAHRHTPEIEQELSEIGETDINISFTPHLIPMDRGILTTSYATLKEGITYTDVKECYQKYYGDEYFIRLLPEGILPETRWVKGSNMVDINFVIDKRVNRIVVMGAIDNLIKGAAGQAVQNMNIVFGLDEKMGLEYIPMFPA